MIDLLKYLFVGGSAAILDLIIFSLQSNYNFEVVDTLDPEDPKLSQSFDAEIALILFDANFGWRQHQCADHYDGGKNFRSY